MQNKTIIVIGLLILGALGILIFQSQEDNSKKVVEKVVENNGSQVMKDLYMEGCVDGDYEVIGFCDCTFNYMHEELGTNRLAEMFIEYGDTDEMSDEMIGSLGACVKFIQ